MICDHTELLLAIWVSRSTMSMADGVTTEPKTRISQRGDENARCRDSRAGGSAPRFLSTHAAVYTTFTVQRHLTSAQTHRAFRAAAMETWLTAVAAA